LQNKESAQTSQTFHQECLALQTSQKHRLDSFLL
jgi:hypothetical protein